MSARVRALERAQVNHETRLRVAEAGMDDLRQTMGAMRKEQRDDAAQIFRKLDTIQGELSMWGGWRTAVKWMAGLLVTLGVAGLSLWVSLR